MNIQVTKTRSIPSWWAGISAVSAFLACKGTTLLVALYPLLGFTTLINPHLQAAVISVLAMLTLLLIFLRRRKSKASKAPGFMALVGCVLIIGAMYVYYNSVVESLGLVLLFVGVVWSGIPVKQNAAASTVKVKSIKPVLSGSNNETVVPG